MADEETAAFEYEFTLRCVDDKIGGNPARVSGTLATRFDAGKWVMALLNGDHRYEGRGKTSMDAVVNHIARRLSCDKEQAAAYRQRPEVKAKERSQGVGVLDRPQVWPAGPIARWLRVPVKWLREEAEAGRVPHLRTGKTFLFEPKAVEAVLVERAKTGSQSVSG